MNEQPTGKTYVGSDELYADVQRCMKLVAEMNSGYHTEAEVRDYLRQITTLEEAKTLLQQSHEEMLRLAGSFSEEELFIKGYYKVTYTTSMAAYFLSVTPYGQAMKLLKTHQKSCKAKK